jgi:hypothetical protein
MLPEEMIDAVHDQVSGGYAEEYGIRPAGCIDRIHGSLFP